MLPEGLSLNEGKRGVTGYISPDTIRGQSTLDHEMVNGDPMVKGPGVTHPSKCMKGKGQSWGFTSRSTARVILGQVLRIATCGTRTHRGDSL